MQIKWLKELPFYIKVNNYFKVIINLMQTPMIHFKILVTTNYSSSFMKN